jgi:hypothetical protein
MLKRILSGVRRFLRKAVSMATDKEMEEFSKTLTPEQHEILYKMDQLVYNNELRLMSEEVGQMILLTVAHREAEVEEMGRRFCTGNFSWMKFIVRTNWWQTEMDDDDES